MPFEIAPQEQTAAQKLAALIDMGRACHPDIEHGCGALFRGNAACAMGFAILAAGLPRNVGCTELAAHLGCSVDELDPLVQKIVRMNDRDRASIPEIVEAVRTQNFPTYAHVGVQKWMTFDEAALVFPVSGKQQPYTWGVDFIGDPMKFDAAILAPKVTVKPQPAAKVRTSAKTGATWPVPKHCYA